MQAVETFKNKSQAKLMNLLAKGQAQSHTVQTCGITAGSAVVGALTMVAGAQGILALFTFLAAPPVALTVGMLGGGVVGWRYMHGYQHDDGNDAPAIPSVTTTASPLSDDLEMINGITAPYAGRLHAAGIHTFAQLAALLPERVHLIIGTPTNDNVIQSTRWIAEARQLAERHKG